MRILTSLLQNSPIAREPMKTVKCSYGAGIATESCSESLHAVENACQVRARSGTSVSQERRGNGLPKRLVCEQKTSSLDPVSVCIFASESYNPHIFVPDENIDRFSWRRFFKVTDRDLDLLNSKQLIRGNVLRFSCAFRL